MGSGIDSTSLYNILGSFWRDIAPGRDLLKGWSNALVCLSNIIKDKYITAGELLSIKNAPIYNQPSWYYLTLDEKTKNNDSTVTYKVPDTLHEVSIIVDKIYNTSRVWTGIFDFYLDKTKHTITFFQDPGVSYVWLMYPKFDDKYLYYYFGQILGIFGETSIEYKKVLETVWDAFVTGTNQKHIFKLLAFYYGIPLTQEDEVVEEIIQQYDQKFIITDKYVYNVPTTAKLSVSKGSVVKANTSLISNFDLLDFRRGILDSRIRELFIPKQMLKGDFKNGLIFENKLVPVVTSIDTPPKVRWEIKGYPEDISLFWQSVDLICAERGTSLYALLVAEYGSCPVEINPLEFLIKYVIRCNGMFVIEPEQINGPSWFINQAENLIHLLLPPWKTLFYIEQLEPEGSPVPSFSPSPSPSPLPLPLM